MPPRLVEAGDEAVDDIMTDDGNPAYWEGPFFEEIDRMNGEMEEKRGTVWGRRAASEFFLFWPNHGL